MTNVRDPLRTLQEAVDLWLAEFARRVEDGARSAETLFMHRENLRYILRRVAATTPVAVVDANLIDSIAVAEADGQRARADGTPMRISARTVSKRLCSLRQVLDHSRRVGWIREVPAFPKLDVRYIPRHQHLRDFSEFERLCATLPIDRADWLWVAVFTGQRPKDIHQLRAYVDCDPFGRPPWVILRSSKTRSPDGLLAQLPRPLAARLRERFKREQLQPGDPLVPEWPKSNRMQTLRKRAQQLGIAACRASDLRRTCGSWAAHELGSLTIGLKDYLGHTSFAMLSRVYARALPPGLADVAKALGAQARRRPRRKRRRQQEGGGLGPPTPLRPNRSSSTADFSASQSTKTTDATPPRTIASPSPLPSASAKLSKVSPAGNSARPRKKTEGEQLPGRPPSLTEHRPNVPPHAGSQSNVANPERGK